MLNALIRGLIPPRVRHPLIRWWRTRIPYDVRHGLRRWWKTRFRAIIARPHRLPGELIVSLTSYPPRFGTLHRTLDSLLRQRVKPDRIILWVADEDVARLPREVLTRKVEIRAVPDVRSFKKLVFALEQFPDAFIATADDDVFYRPDWLEILVAGYEPGVITCHRVHRISLINGSVAPYEDWALDVQDDEARRPSPDLVPTGVGGILYPPKSLHPEVLDRSTYLALCPTADDLWFYWQARRAGSLYKKVGGVFELILWKDTQKERLFNDNASENDIHIANLAGRYGIPGHRGGDSPRHARSLSQSAKQIGSLRIEGLGEIPTPAPFFITGPGRCGTTLVRRLCVERTLTVIPPENYTLGVSYKLYSNAKGGWREKCQAIVTHLTQNKPGWELFNIEEGALLSILLAMPSSQQTLQNFWHVFHAVWARTCGRMDYRNWGDKTPASVRRLPNLIQMFPQAKFIFLIRDGYDVVLSYGKMETRQGQFLEGAKRWLDSTEMMLRFRQKHPNSSLLLRYEDVVANPGRALEQIIDTAGLQEASEADAHRLMPDIQAWPHLHNVVDEITEESVGRGRRELHPATFEAVRRIIDDMQVRLGYSS